MNGVGESREKPWVLGAKNGDEPRFVESTGLYEGMPKGTQAWVTGDRVQVGINRGNLILISTQHGQPLVEKVTRISTKEPPTVASTRPWHGGETSGTTEGANITVSVTDGAAVNAAPSAEPPAEPDPYNPADHTVAEVIAHIEEHPDDAGAVLAAERAGKNRKSIIREFQ